VAHEVIKETFIEDGWKLDQDSNRLPLQNKPRALKLHSPDSFGVKVKVKGAVFTIYITPLTLQVSENVIGLNLAVVKLTTVQVIELPL
jgi:hypothetical protein